MRGEYPSLSNAVVVNRGTTSACAENTHPPTPPERLGGNYLRVRGEYRAGETAAPNQQELPPRARRILKSDIPFLAGNGTTSACAENTHRNTIRYQPTGNYLRVRGEYKEPFDSLKESVELPPRARRIRQNRRHGNLFTGTTSACAENTYRASLSPGRGWNYLRVRGEYSSRYSYSPIRLELPPRARRIPQNPPIRGPSGGTTSACAENTPGSLPLSPDARNYLRVRGEYRIERNDKRIGLELPPRARRIHRKP